MGRVQILETLRNASERGRAKKNALDSGVPVGESTRVYSDLCRDDKRKLEGVPSEGEAQVSFRNTLIRHDAL